LKYDPERERERERGEAVAPALLSLQALCPCRTRPRPGGRAAGLHTDSSQTGILRPRSPSFDLKQTIHDGTMGFDFVAPSYLPPRSFNFEFGGSKGGRDFVLKSLTLLDFYSPRRGVFSFAERLTARACGDLMPSLHLWLVQRAPARCRPVAARASAAWPSWRASSL
jgi:hypothetical protein